MFALMKYRTSSILGHVGLKTRSPGQMLEKPYVCSRGHIFSPIIMKLDQHVCLDEISHKMGHVGSETRSLCQVLEKPCVPSRTVILYS